MVDETKLNSENLVDGAVNANEGEEPTAKKRTELDEAIALVNSGLENLSPEDLSKVYSLLKSHSGEINDAGSAFAKLDTFAQKKVQDFADGKENVAVEELNGMSSLETEVNSIHAPAADKPQHPAADRVTKLKAEADKNLGTENLTPEISPIIDANLQATDTILAANAPLARKEDGTLVNPEMETFSAFFEHMDLVVSEDSESDGAKTKEELLQKTIELAVLAAQAQVAIDPNFSKLNEADKRKKLMEAVASQADTLTLSMLKAQMLNDFQTENADLLAKKDNLTKEEQKQLEEKVKAFNAQVSQATKSYMDRKYPEQNFKLSNTIGSTVVIASGREQVAFGARVAEKTGNLSLKQRALKFDAKMKEKHPKLYSATKKGLTSAVVGYATGGVGLAVLAGIRSYKLVKTSYKTYKDSGFEGSYMGYLKANPKEMTSLVTSVVLTGVSVAFAGADWAEHGANAFGNVGHLFGDQAATQASNKILKASLRGGISLTSGLASAQMDWRAARLETDPDKRKKLYWNAAKTAGISFAGAAVGLASAEYGNKFFGWLKERFVDSDNAGVDGITGAAPRVGGTQTINAQNVMQLEGKQLDAKLHELGINPDRYKDLDPTQKMLMLNKRITELGPLAKEDASTSGATSVAETEQMSTKRLEAVMKLSAERHPGVDMTKIYDQMKASGIKNPQEAFYKLEQARLLAPNDKIMTVDGTNIRDTMARALKGEKLTAADMEIMNRSMANVNNTGHYLNDVRSQGGTGYSYRPGGKVIENENVGGSKAGGATKVEAENAGGNKAGGATKTEADVQTGGVGLLDVEKMSNQDKLLYLDMMNSFKGKGGENWQLEANKEYLHYRQLLTEGKSVEAEALAKSYKTPVEAENEKQPQKESEKDEHNPYKANSGDSKQLISAKREASQAEASYKAAVVKVKMAEAEMKSVQNLPVEDPKRIAAEYKHALAMKEEVKKQFTFSKKELSLAKAERNQLGDNIEDRKKMEARVGEIGKELKLYGIEKTEAAKVDGDYGSDKRSVREYFKDALRNKKNYAPSMKLLKEREELLKEMTEQGPRPLMEQQYADAEAKVDSLSKRSLYRENEEKEVGKPSAETEKSQTESSNPSNNIKKETNNHFREVEDRIEGVADKFATTSLAAAEKMKAGEIFGLKDSVGNNQFVGVDKSGHAFKVTEVANSGKGVEIIGHVYKIEVGKDHPMYNALHSDDTFVRGEAKEAFYEQFQKSVVNKEFTQVKPIATNTATNVGNSTQNSGGGR